MARFVALSFMIAFTIVGCSRTDKSPDVTNNVRQALDQSNLQNVHVSDDREKGVVTLTGNVPYDDDKARANGIAKSNAAGQAVANEIGVVPPNDSDVKTVNADLDKGIKENLDAVLVQSKLNHQVRFDVKNGVVTLKGRVDSSGRRAEAEHLARFVPNVQEVVNELDVHDQKATATN